MTIRLATDPETGVRSLSTEFYSPIKQPAGPQIAKGDHSVDPTLATNVRTAEPLWTPPPSAKLVVEDEAALRATLADRLSALAEAQEAELAVSARISVAVREQGEAKGRHTAAAEKTAAARLEAAAAVRAWLASRDTDRPGSDALSAALAIENAARVDVEVMETVLGGLKVEHEAAIAETKRILNDAQMIRDRIVSAQACQMAAEVIEVDDRALELRRTLFELLKAMPVGVPLGVQQAMTPKNIPWEVMGITPGVQRWSKLRNDLLTDPQATVAPLGD